MGGGSPAVAAAGKEKRAPRRRRGGVGGRRRQEAELGRALPTGTVPPATLAAARVQCAELAGHRSRRRGGGGSPLGLAPACRWRSTRNRSTDEAQAGYAASSTNQSLSQLSTTCITHESCSAPSSYVPHCVFIGRRDLFSLYLITTNNPHHCLFSRCLVTATNTN